MWMVLRSPIRRMSAGLLFTAVVLAVGSTACSSQDTEVPAATPTDTAPSTGPNVKVPQGVTLTDAGATLEVGDKASAPVGKGARASVLSVTVSKVVKGSMKDFTSFVLSAKQRASTPYYVSATVTNEGPGTMRQTDVPLFGFDSTDTAFPPTSLVGTFDRCAGGPLPAGFAPQDRVKPCLVYLVPPKATLQAVQLRTSNQTEPISWPVGSPE